jgi:hypothetical protein
MRGLALIIIFISLLGVGQATNVQLGSPPVASTAPPHRAVPAFPLSTWMQWAQVAWRYWNQCYSPTTGLTYDACNYTETALWGQASDIFGLIDAYELDLIPIGTFTSRVNLILNFLDSMTLYSCPSVCIPYSLYFSSSGSPDTSSGMTDPADYGRLLIAEYSLRQLLSELGLITQANMVNSAVSRVNNNYFAGSLAGDLYGYYASLGFMLWGLIGPSVSSAQNGFDNLIKSGPYVPAACPPQPCMYGVSGIPTDTDINGEPFADALLEAGSISQVTSLPSWNDFTKLSKLVYNAMANRSLSTSDQEYWTEGGLDVSPGFDYQWVVYSTGNTWIVYGTNGSPLSIPQVPVAFFKLAFAYNALYNTAYTQNTLNNYASHVETNDGFEEGLYANGYGYDTDKQIQSSEMILTAAALEQTSQVSTTTSSSTTSTTTSSTNTFLTTTTTTSISTSTVGQLCTATSTTSTTSVIIQQPITTTTTTQTTTGTSTFSTTTSSTLTSTTVTTTTVTLCTQTSTSTTTSTTLTTFIRPSTSITLTVSPSSDPVGSPVNLSGAISPNPGVVAVTISLSQNSGGTWTTLLSIMTDSTGAYSTNWSPPYPGSYLLEASWNGNNQLAPSQSSPQPLTVTGSAAPTPTVLLASPATTPHGQTLTLSIVVFNPGSSALDSNVAIQIAGPNNYVLFDVIQVNVPANSQSTGYYDWMVPAQTGTYTITLSLLPQTISGVDTETIHVT